MNNLSHVDAGKIVYWHHELPPLDAELVAEHTIEATSGRVPGTLSHRDELWDRCYRELMVNTEARLAQEIGRLGGQYAHVHKESIEPHHDDMAGEAWLHGRFSYMLCRRPSQAREPNRGSGTDNAKACASQRGKMTTRMIETTCTSPETSRPTRAENLLEHCDNIRTVGRYCDSSCGTQYERPLPVNVLLNRGIIKPVPSLKPN